MPKRTAGFTLLELLIVLAIVGVLATFVAVTIFSGDHSRELRADANTMIRTIELARREVSVRNELWGIMISQYTLSFTRLDEETNIWTPVTKRPYGTIQYEREFMILFDSPETRNESNQEGTTVPQVLLQPNGEVTPFQLTLLHVESNTTVTLQTDGLKRMSLVQS